MNKPRGQSKGISTIEGGLIPNAEPVKARIQSHGVLLLFDRNSGVLIHRAGDCGQLLGLKATEWSDAKALLGIDINDLVDCCSLNSSGAPVYIGEIQPKGRKPLAMLGHITGVFVAVELMAGDDKITSASALDLAGVISNGINSCKNIGEACGIAVEHVRAIVGFDSIRVYQFLGESASITAGSRPPDVVVYLGSQDQETSLSAHSWTSDQRNPLHVIPDLASPPVAIEPAPSSSLDLSRCILRSGTSDRIQEMMDVGFRASISISLLVEGKLWGLIGCFHPKPRSVSVVAQLLCRHVAITLSAFVGGFRNAKSTRSGSIPNDGLVSILEGMRTSDDPERKLRTSGDQLKQLIECSGFVLLDKDQLITGAGEFPVGENLRNLSVFMEAKLGNRISYSIDRLGDEYANAPAVASYASGVLSIRLEAWRPLMALWLRPAQFEDNEWSREAVSGQSRPWTRCDIEVVELFRVWVGYAMQRHHLIKLNAELADANALLSMQATTDPLTELPNRRLFNQRLESEWERARREKKLLALVAIDIDLFKEYNDCLGHPAGDECLKKVAHAISSSCRTIDVAARLGGDEFALILPGLDVSGATMVAERVRMTVEGLRIEHPNTAGGIVTISLGVASGSPAEGSKVSEVLSAMDRALYRAKAGGRNETSG